MDVGRFCVHNFLPETMCITESNLDPNLTDESAVPRQSIYTDRRYVQNTITFISNSMQLLYLFISPGNGTREMER